MVKYSAEQYSILRYIMSQHRTGHSRVIITAEHRAVQSTADSIEVQRDAVDMMQDSVIKISAISTIVDSTVQDILSSTAHSATSGLHSLLTDRSYTTKSHKLSLGNAK
jgi:hypothetical protein